MMRLPLWATVFTVFSVAILCGLGTWQVKRLHWKEALLARLDAAYAQNPMEHPLGFNDIRSDEDFLRGVVRGTYRRDLEIAIAPRTHNGVSGYHILTPLELQDGSMLLVNRGWVPLDFKEDRTPEHGVFAAGTLRKPEHPNPFVPKNNLAKEQWYRIDLKDIAQARHIKKLAPLVMYAERDNSAAIYPLKTALRWEPPNNHLQYAIFWFTMAMLLIVMYGLRFRKSR